MDKEILEILRELKESQIILETKVDGIQIQTEENTQILKLIDEGIKFINAEQENIKNDIAHMHRDIKLLKICSSIS